MKWGRAVICSSPFGPVGEWAELLGKLDRSSSLSRPLHNKVSRVNWKVNSFRGVFAFWNDDTISPLWVETCLNELHVKLEHRFPKERKAMLLRRENERAEGTRDWVRRYSVRSWMPGWQFGTYFSREAILLRYGGKWLEFYFWNTILLAVWGIKFGCRGEGGVG